MTVYAPRKPLAVEYSSQQQAPELPGAHSVDYGAVAAELYDPGVPIPGQPPETDHGVNDEQLTRMAREVGRVVRGFVETHDLGSTEAEEAVSYLERVRDGLRDERVTVGALDDGLWLLAHQEELSTDAIYRRIAALRAAAEAEAKREALTETGERPVATEPLDPHPLGELPTHTDLGRSLRANLPNDYKPPQAVAETAAANLRTILALRVGHDEGTPQRAFQLRSDLAQVLLDASLRHIALPFELRSEAEQVIKRLDETLF